MNNNMQNNSNNNTQIIRKGDVIVVTKFDTQLGSKLIKRYRAYGSVCGRSVTGFGSTELEAYNMLEQSYAGVLNGSMLERNEMGSFTMCHTYVVA